MSYEQRGCAQLHLFYPSTWSAWEGLMPPGFGPDGSDPAGATTTVYQHVSRCERTADDGTTTTFDEAWVGVRVTPPPEMSDPAAPVQLVPLDIVLSDPALVALYQAWGFGVARLGEVAWTDTETPAGRLGEVVIRGEGATMTLRTVIGPPMEGSVGGSDRVFAVTDRTVTGWFDYAWPGWTDVGMGAVVFTAEGGDAPPVYDGLAHQVADTDVNVTFTPAPPSA